MDINGRRTRTMQRRDRRGEERDVERGEEEVAEREMTFS